MCFQGEDDNIELKTASHQWVPTACDGRPAVPFICAANIVAVAAAALLCGAILSQALTDYITHKMRLHYV